MHDQPDLRLQQGIVRNLTNRLGQQFLLKPVIVIDAVTDIMFRANEPIPGADLKNAISEVLAGYGYVYRLDFDVGRYFDGTILNGEGVIGTLLVTNVTGQKSHCIFLSVNIF